MRVQQFNCLTHVWEDIPALPADLDNRRSDTHYLTGTRGEVYVESLLLDGGFYRTHHETREAAWHWLRSSFTEGRVNLSAPGVYLPLGYLPHLKTLAHVERQQERQRQRDAILEELRDFNEAQLEQRYGDLCLTWTASRLGGNCQPGTQEYIYLLSAYGGLPRNQHNITLREFLAARQRIMQRAYHDYNSRGYLLSVVAGALWFARHGHKRTTPRPAPVAPEPQVEAAPDPFTTRQRTTRRQYRLGRKHAGWVCYDDNVTAFISYGTVIGLMTPQGASLTNQHFSSTTSRHKGTFYTKFASPPQVVSGGEFAAQCAAVGLSALRGEAPVAF